MYTPLKTDMNDWQTGDLILFKNINSCFGKMMKFLLEANTRMWVLF